MIVQKIWFFIATKSGLNPGYRLKDGDRPTEKTFQNLVDTMVSKNIDDRAKESSNVNVTTLAGTVVASTSEQAIMFQGVLADRTLAVQPHQLPETTKLEEEDIVLTDDTFGETFGEEILEITNVSPTVRNSYKHKISDSFVEWLGGILSNISTALSFNIGVTNAHTAQIADMQAAIDALSGGTFTGAIPIGSWTEYGGTADPSANFLVCNGRSLLRSAYPALFAILGTKYGEGVSPGTTFAIPDYMEGRTSKGINMSIPEYNTLGKKGGSDGMMLIPSNIPPHQHPTNSFGATIRIPSNSSPDFDKNENKGAHNHYVNTSLLFLESPQSPFSTRVVNTNISSGTPFPNSILEQPKLDTISRSSNTRVEKNGGHGHDNTAFEGNVGYQYDTNSITQTKVDINSPFVIANWIIRVS